MAGHYGSNRQATNSNLEDQKHMNTHEKSLSKNGKSTLSNNILSTDETKSNYNYLCLPSSNDRTGRNTSIEELKTNKCPSNHSPLLTKRKNSQKKGGNSTVRNKHKQQKNKSKFVSLNGNLRSSSSHAHEDGKSTERPKISKLSVDATNRVHLKSQFENHALAQDAMHNVELIQTRLAEKQNKYMTSKNRRQPIDIMDHLRSLEDAPETNLILPISTISTQSRRNVHSKQSSRNSRNKSSSSTNKQSQKFMIAKPKKVTKLKNLHKLECYKIPLNAENAIIRDPSSGSRSRSRRARLNSSNNKKQQIHPPYPDRYPTALRDQFNMHTKYDSLKQYKHTKSNSEAVTKHTKDFNDSGVDNDHVYANRNSLKIQNYSPDKHVLALSGNNENIDQHIVVLTNNFNTVKYSQSPFLNKLTNLKQRLSNKEKKGQKDNFIKGHKSRNSMFPKSYTEVNHYSRREPEIYNKLNGRNSGFALIPEEVATPTHGGRDANPYTNMEVENEVTSAYGNDPNKINANIVFKEYNKMKLRFDSDKKRAPTDTTRSKTGIDASNDSGKGTPNALKY